MPEISLRAEQMPASPIRKLVPLADAARARGTKIYHLNIGQPDLPSPKEGLESLKHIDRKVLEYSPSDGYRSLREKLVTYYEQYQIKLSPEEIIVTTGGSEAVLFAFMSCLNPGDEIIVPEPAYANYMAFAISAGAVIRPVVALVTALAGGWTVNRLTRSETDGILPAAEGGEVRRSGSRFVEALRYGFVDMIQDIGRWLVLGLLVAGLITILVPDNFFASFADKPLLNMAVVLLFSIPMYLCATGSIPIAAALMLKGLSPGAALVLLMAGPATNTASILVIGKVLGRRTLTAYLGAIVAGAVGFGPAIDYLLPAAWFVPSGAVHAACHGEAGYSWVEVASSALLSALLAYALMKRFIHRKNDTSMTKQIYRVGGMSCNHCKASVEKNLALLPSVTAVEVDLTAGTVAVEGTADAAEIRKVIEELGFEYKGRA